MFRLHVNHGLHGILHRQLLAFEHHLRRCENDDMIAALFGFTGISAASADIARILFFIAIVIFLVLLVAGLMAGSTLF